jgi:hypothetical protein
MRPKPPPRPQFLQWIDAARAKTRNETENMTETQRRAHVKERATAFLKRYGLGHLLQGRAKKHRRKAS